MRRNNSKFFENRDCEFYPCHNGLKYFNFNCLFCYCPFYNDTECGGNFEVLSNGIKDCTNCIYPHVPENYDKIVERLRDKK